MNLKTDDVRHVHNDFVKLFIIAHRFFIPDDGSGRVRPWTTRLDMLDQQDSQCSVGERGP